MRSLQWRLAGWFAISLIVVVGLFEALTIMQLRYELRVEQWERVHPDNPDFILHGTYSEAEINDIVGHVLHDSLLLSFPAALVALLLGRYLARKSLRPVAAINRQLQSIDARRLDARVEVTDADVELATITRNINGLLERVEGSYRDVSEFSLRVAHELRTPLTLMRLQLEESAVKIEPELAESLQDELRRLEGFVEQCLLIARAERGQLETTREPVNLSAILGDILEPFRLLAREQGRKIVESKKEVPLIRTSDWAIRQILQNLLTNALCHGEGSIRTEVGVRGSEVELLISNRIDATRKSGTGLGLRIVEALAQADGSLQFGVSESASHFTARLYWPIAHY